MFTIDNTVQGMLLDIKENPDDDTPRLALADYLQDMPDEQSRVYGQFIRAQVQKLDTAEVGEIYQRIANQYETAILRVDFGYGYGNISNGCRVVFERGFISRAEMSSAGWRLYGKKIAKYHPSVTIEIAFEMPQLQAVFETPQTSQWPNISVYQLHCWYRRMATDWELHDGFIDPAIFDMMPYHSRVEGVSPCKIYESDLEARHALLEGYRNFSGGFFKS